MKTKESVVEVEVFEVKTVCLDWYYLYFYIPGGSGKKTNEMHVCMYFIKIKKTKNYVILFKMSTGYLYPISNHFFK